MIAILVPKVGTVSCVFFKERNVVVRIKDAWGFVSRKDYRPPTWLPVLSCLPQSIAPPTSGPFLAPWAGQLKILLMALYLDILTLTLNIHWKD